MVHPIRGKRPSSGNLRRVTRPSQSCTRGGFLRLDPKEPGRRLMVRGKQLRYAQWTRRSRTRKKLYITIPGLTHGRARTSGRVFDRRGRTKARPTDKGIRRGIFRAPGFTGTGRGAPTSTERVCRHGLGRIPRRMGVRRLRAERRSQSARSPAGGTCANRCFAARKNAIASS